MIVGITTYRKERRCEPTEEYGHGRSPGNDLGTLGPATERDGLAGELAALGVEISLGLTGIPAACLH